MTKGRIASIFDCHAHKPNQHPMVDINKKQGTYRAEALCGFDSGLKVFQGLLVVCSIARAEVESRN